MLFESEDFFKPKQFLNFREPSTKYAKYLLALDQGISKNTKSMKSTDPKAYTNRENNTLFF
jgi:hypothetical protein